MRRNNLQKSSKNSTNQRINYIQGQCSQLLLDENLESLARETGFVQRKGTISPSSFAKTLIFNIQEQDQLSLVDLKCDFLNYENCAVSDVAIHKRFTPEAVMFLKNILSQMLSVNTNPEDELDIRPSFFNAINIKDSTKFKLPVSYYDSYPGYGSYNKTSALMNIQYEYDILTQNWKRLEFTKARRNDQTESKETISDIESGSLNIRDLGYITLTYLKAVEEKAAYYLNRLPKIGVFIKVDDKYEPIDWKALDRNIKKKNLEYLEIEVYLGKDKLKTRMVLAPVPESITNKRIREAKKGGKRSSGAYQLSKEYKLKARYNIFITNTPKEVLATQQVIKAYKVRWDIELIFKTWKSNLKIHKIKSVKKERMECQLLARFIWILLNSKLLQVSNSALKSSDHEQECSLFKLLKRLKGYSQTLRNIFFKSDQFIQWYNTIILPLIPSLVVESRLRKPTNNQLVNELFKR